MKYTNTSRLLSLIFHAIIFLGFGTLGVYFGLALATTYLNESVVFSVNIPEAPYNLFSEIGIVGLSLATISAYGFVQAYKSIQNPKDDAPVIKAFNAFIAEGFIAGIFCLANGVIYFDAIRGGTEKGLGFLIAAMIILFIGLMIATNIPMVKLYDNKDQTPLLSSLAMAAAVFFGWATIITLGTLIGSWANNSASSWSHVINSQLVAFMLVYAVNTVLLVFSSLFLKKGEELKKKLAGYFTSLTIFLTSLCFIADGVIGLVYGNTSGNVKNVHLEGINLALPKSGDAYAIICLVVGALLLVGSIVFVGMHGTGKLKKKAK